MKNMFSFKNSFWVFFCRMGKYILGPSMRQFQNVHFLRDDVLNSILHSDWEQSVRWAGPDVCLNSAALDPLLCDSSAELSAGRTEASGRHKHGNAQASQDAHTHTHAHTHTGGTTPPHPPRPQLPVQRHSRAEMTVCAHPALPCQHYHRLRSFFYSLHDHFTKQP